jgi:hypothetical protein
MFLAYRRHPVSDTWTPPVPLATAAACYRYCALHHGMTPEIRIVDEDDCIVLQMREHVLRIPLPHGRFREMPLTPLLVEVICAAAEDVP